jgi:hypothetical protein
VQVVLTSATGLIFLLVALTFRRRFTATAEVRS